MVRRYGAQTMTAVAVTVLIWSTTFAALVAALDHFSPQHLLFLRWTLTALLFVVYGALTRMRLPDKADLPHLAVAGLLGFAVYQMLLVNGQTGVSATMAGFLINMSPVFTTVIAVALGRDRAGWNTWAGLAACTGGLLLMGQGKGGLGEIGPSAALVLLAALSFAGYTLVTKPLLAKYRPLEVTTYAMVAGSLPFIVFAPGSIEAVRTAQAGDIATLLFLAIFPGGIAYVLWSYAVKGLTPGLASRFLYLIPVLGVPVAWVWVGEAPQLLTLVGGLVTVAGVSIASVRTWPRLWAPTRQLPAPGVTPARDAA